MYDINFFEPYLPQPKKTNVALIGFIIFLVLIIGAIGYLELDYNSKKNDLVDSIDKVKAKTDDPELKEKLEKLSAKKQIQTSLTDTLDRLTLVDAYMQVKKTVYSGLLTDVTNSVPENCYIRDINIENDIIKISGYAKGYDSIAQFEHQLRQMKKLKQVFSPSMSEENSNYAFSISAIMKVEVNYESKQ